MTAVYTLAHSCLQSDNSSNTLSVSPQSLNNSGSIPRRSSLSRAHHHHHGSINNSGYHHSTYSSSPHQYASSPSMPLSIGNASNNSQSQSSSHYINTTFNPVNSPVLSFSPQSTTTTKQRANTTSTSSFSSSFGSNSTAKSGLSNLLQHHAGQQQQQQEQHNGNIHTARPATATATAAPLLASAPVTASTAVVPSTTTSQSFSSSSSSPLPYIHSLSIIDTFQKVLSEVDIDSCEAAGENAFLVCDLARVYSQYKLWERELGSLSSSKIEAFFAVKCNPDPLIIKLMVNLGIGFDCASQQEISMVLKAGAKPNKIIYANPCKASSFIRFAYKNGIDMMTFDNTDELIKISKFHPKAKMVLRILTDDSGSLCKLGLKFGAPLKEVKTLLEKAKELNVEVIGISFHVGSGCKNPLLFKDAILRAKYAFKIGKSLGFNFNLLDIGGGFENDNFKEIAGILRDAVVENFNPSSSSPSSSSFNGDSDSKNGIRIIAEPGRYFVSHAFEMATNIIARRGRGGSNNDNQASHSSHVGGDDDEMNDDGEDEEDSMVMYYINDGVYGAFNCTMFDHQVVHPKVLTSEGNFVSSPSTYFNNNNNNNNNNNSNSNSLIEDQQREEVEEVKMEACSIWGPTCDSIDCVSSKTFLPISKIKVGDWLKWENMGAYTICAASQFNGFKTSKVIYTICDDDDEEEGNGSTERRIRELLNRS